MSLSRYSVSVRTTIPRVSRFSAKKIAADSAARLAGDPAPTLRPATDEGGSQTRPTARGPSGRGRAQPGARWSRRPLAAGYACPTTTLYPLRTPTLDVDVPLDHALTATALQMPAGSWKSLENTWKAVHSACAARVIRADNPDDGPGRRPAGIGWDERVRAPLTFAYTVATSCTPGDRSRCTPGDRRSRRRPIADRAYSQRGTRRRDPSR